jgi:hypothetical protein
VWIPWWDQNGSLENNQTWGTKLGLDGVGSFPIMWAWPAYTATPSGVRWDNIAYASAC